MIVKLESFDELLRFGAGSSGIGGAQTCFWTGHGWHFYSLLRIRDGRMKGEDVRDVRRVVKLYTSYTKAAIAAQVFSQIILGLRCEILEHQGTVVHFYFPNPKKESKASIVRFGKVLTALVDKHVRKYYADDITQFHMGAEYGTSVIVKCQSPEASSSSDSVISLGPCANNPAHKMGESKDEVRRPLWIRNNAKCDWDCEECLSGDALIDVGNLMSVLEFDFDDRQITESLIDDRNLPVSRFAFFFRADMDGFTTKVAAAFATNSVGDVVKEFCDYMESANQWQISTDMKVSPHPWAGDCFNALVAPNSAERSDLLERSYRKQYPIRIVEEWEKYVADKTYNGGAWVYAVSGGDIYTFPVQVGQRLFKLSVGRPVGLTQHAVNLRGSVAGDLIMHVEELQPLSPTAKESFVAFKDGSHARYKRQGGADRVALSQMAVVPYARHQQSPIWQMVLAYDVSLSATIRRSHTTDVWRLVSSGDYVPKSMDMKICANTNVPLPYKVKWQVTNNGSEAAYARQLRGDFEDPKGDDVLGLTKRETTRYSGMHWVYCYILKDGDCVARSLPFVVRVR